MLFGMKTEIIKEKPVLWEMNVDDCTKLCHVLNKSDPHFYSGLVDKDGRAVVRKINDFSNDLVEVVTEAE